MKTFDRIGSALGVALVSGAGICASREPDSASSVVQTDAVVSEVLAEVALVDGHNDAPCAIRSRVSNRIIGFDFRDTTVLES